MRLRLTFLIGSVKGLNRFKKAWIFIQRNTKWQMQNRCEYFIGSVENNADVGFHDELYVNWYGSICIALFKHQEKPLDIEENVIFCENMPCLWKISDMQCYEYFILLLQLSLFSHGRVDSYREQLWIDFIFFLIIFIKP